ncbi:hypothetical protein O181_048229 [Austropuccinia psidii MF-1]|uniref:Uncharacterized protein n=1 Tax=Austropuccinia psidii MF-1 TaxID=1389203 RepID=A0A9Q3DSK7_9BASI|nr:hypothetical protein [Austropuccinia psidii MF-1]
MSSKLTELTESSPSVPPPSALCGSAILTTRRLKFLVLLVLNVWPREKIAFRNSTHNLKSVTSVLLGRSHVVILGQRLPTSEGTFELKRMGHLGRSSQFQRAQLPILLQDILIRDVERWTNVGVSIPVGGRPIYCSSAVPISRINTEGVVKIIRRFADSPADPDAEGSDELDGEEVKVVNNLVGHQSSTSPSQPPAKRFQSHLIHSTLRNFEPNLASIPTSLPHYSPSSSPTRPSINPAVRPSPIQQ